MVMIYSFLIQHLSNKLFSCSSVWPPPSLNHVIKLYQWSMNHHHLIRGSSHLTNCVEIDGAAWIAWTLYLTHHHPHDGYYHRVHIIILKCWPSSNVPISDLPNIIKCKHSLVISAHGCGSSFNCRYICCCGNLLLSVHEYIIARDLCWHLVAWVKQNNWDWVEIWY